MSIREHLSHVLSGYLDAREMSIAGHPMASLLRRDLQSVVRDTLASGDLGTTTDLIVRGSPGQGTWARIPWLAVFHTSETTTAMRGVFVVYLFAADMSAVYLTLNQGVTDSTLEDLAAVGSSASKAVGGVSGFESGALASGTLVTPGAGGQPHAYEAGCIFYRKYEANQLPSDTELRRDLLTIVRAYVDYVEGRTPSAAEPTSVQAPAPSPQPVVVPPVAAQLAGDELRKRLLDRVRELSPTAFERLLGELWRRLGYQDVSVTRRSADGGIDGEFVVPLVNMRVAFQAKKYAEENRVGTGPVRELNGVLSNRYERGIFVTTSSFRAGVQEEIDEHGFRIVLIKGEELADLMLDAKLGLRTVVERAEVDESVFAGLEG